MVLNWRLACLYTRFGLTRKWFMIAMVFAGPSAWQALAEVLNTSEEQLLRKVENPQRRFVYLERMVTPPLANYIHQLRIPGVGLKEESRRPHFYPTGENFGPHHCITNIDAEWHRRPSRRFITIYSRYTGATSLSQKMCSGRMVEELEFTESELPQDLTLKYRPADSNCGLPRTNQSGTLSPSKHLAQLWYLMWRRVKCWLWSTTLHTILIIAPVCTTPMLNSRLLLTVSTRSTVKPLVVLGALQAGICPCDER